MGLAVRDGDLGKRRAWGVVGRYAVDGVAFGSGKECGRWGAGGRTGDADDKMIHS